MVDVYTEIQIACSREKVAEYAANPDSAPEWYVNITSVEWKTQKPLSIGTQINFQAQFLGRQLKYTYEIVEFIPGRKLVMCTAEGPFPMETIYTWETVENGYTLMKLRNRGKPSGFAKWLSPLMELAIKRANKKDLMHLKEILEKRNSANL